MFHKECMAFDSSLNVSKTFILYSMIGHCIIQIFILFFVFYFLLKVHIKLLQF